MLLEVLENTQLHSATMSEAFLYRAAPIDASTVENTFVLSQWSPVGSNRYKKEKKTMTHWRDFLQDLEGNNS